MRILVDAMGGDLAPDEIVKGAVHAQQELGAEIVLVGQRAAIEACLRPPQEGRFHDGRAQHAA